MGTFTYLISSTFYIIILNMKCDSNVKLYDELEFTLKSINVKIIYFNAQ